MAVAGGRGRERPLTEGARLREGLPELEARRARLGGLGKCSGLRKKWGEWRRSTGQKRFPRGFCVAGCAVLAEYQQTEPVPGPPLGRKTWRRQRA